MKNLLYVIAFLFCFLPEASAQVPQAFNFQGIAKDAVGAPIASSTFDVRIRILNSTSTEELEEIHNITTSLSGVFSLQIGTVEPADFGNIEWLADTYTIQVGIDPDGDGTFEDLTPNAQLLSVPYALVAEKAKEIDGFSLSNTSATQGQILVWNGTEWAPSNVQSITVTTNEIVNNTILAEDIADNAISSNQIADGTITTNDLATDVVTTNEILNNTILSEDIADNAISSNQIADGTITTDDLATDVVTTNEILNSTILSEDIADNAISSNQIADGTITADDLATDVVTTNEILNNTILSEDIADGAITADDLAAGVNSENVEDNNYYQGFACGVEFKSAATDNLKLVSPVTYHWGFGIPDNTPVTGPSSCGKSKYLMEFNFDPINFNGNVATREGTIGFGTMDPYGNSSKHYARITIVDPQAPLAFQATNTPADQGGLWRVSNANGYLNFSVNTAPIGSEFDGSSGSAKRPLRLYYGGNVGRVGIGITTGTPQYELDVNGTAKCVNLIETSDRRFKKDITSLDTPLQKILDIEGVTYLFKQEVDGKRNFSDRQQIGFIAQDLEKVLPELVYQDDEGYYSVNYSGVIPVLVEAIKQQEAEKQELATQVEELRAMVEALSQKIDGNQRTMTVSHSDNISGIK